MNEPVKGSLWRHTNGNRYWVLAVSNTHSPTAKHPPDVIYVTDISDSPDDLSCFAGYKDSASMAGIQEKYWTRPVTDWARSFTFVMRVDLNA